MKRCTKGLHEMTEENTYRDGKGRRHCRGCIRRRKAEKRNHKAHHKAETFTKARTAWDEALDADPPVILWRLHPVRKIQVPVHIYDPHTERADRKVAS